MLYRKIWSPWVKTPGGSGSGGGGGVPCQPMNRASPAASRIARRDTSGAGEGVQVALFPGGGEDARRVLRQHGADPPAFPERPDREAERRDRGRGAVLVRHVAVLQRHDRQLGEQREQARRRVGRVGAYVPGVEEDGRAGLAVDRRDRAAAASAGAGDPQRAERVGRVGVAGEELAVGPALRDVAADATL